MKIYRSKIISKMSELVICNYGELLYESKGYVGGSIYKPANGSYPQSQKDVEDNPDSFEFVREDDEHDSDYYLTRIYTQEQVDKMLNKK